MISTITAANLVQLPRLSAAEAQVLTTQLLPSPQPAGGEPPPGAT